MSVNSFGHVFRFMTWGESHGPGLGVVIDGCPPGIALAETDIQPWMDKRRPGQSRHTTQRREPDAVKIMSGVYEGRTTGTPIHLMIENVDQRSKDYSKIAAKYRPGHADYTYDAKYGFRDPRGGGRSSARETAARVAAGAVARKVLGETIAIRGYLTELGGIPIDRSRFDDAAIDANSFFSPDPVAAEEWEAAVDAARKDGNSLGAVAECMATGVPAGWGAPVYAKLDGELAAAMMSINATKGVEIGNGFEAARITGRDNADEMAPGNEGPRFLSNNAGGILGGISNGDVIVCRTAFKPTSSILTPLKTVTRDGEETEISTKGRHDPCVGIRGVPVVEAMMALVLADQMLLHRAQCG
ncbi:chorismate synthase [Parasphingopyxis sp.]|uniref:chorismate synthase n=1 Tax=Parasphingopyxis sp. TaxID=1920299 RepID=UPI0026160852|nr:chorismate synthase [Parasphingopyxis sp.]